MLVVIGWGIAVYGAVLGLAWLGQGSLMYPAPRRPIVPELPGATLERVPAPRGRTAYALHLPAATGEPTLVHFHGNGEELADQLPLARAFARLGIGFFAVEYPGYGLARDEAPSEHAIYEDAEAALARLRALGVGPDRTVLMGLSLGSGVAAEMALRGHGSRLVLLAPYTSMVDMARRMAPFLPVGVLVRDRYDTAAKAPKLTLPALVVHGRRDSVIPHAMGERVDELLPRSRLVSIEDAGHNDLFARTWLYQEIAAFSRGRDR